MVQFDGHGRIEIGRERGKNVFCFKYYFNILIFFFYHFNNVMPRIKMISNYLLLN